MNNSSLNISKRDSAGGVQGLTSAKMSSDGLLSHIDIFYGKP